MAAGTGKQPCLGGGEAGIAGREIMRHASFPPVVDDHVEILILGSLPGAASLKAGRYYANPRNQFWKLLGAVLGVELAALDYDARLATLLRQRIGLWDVIASAERQGSLDTAICAPQANDLQRLATSLPALRTIAFNGATAARLGAAELGPLAVRFRLLPLPSSSPAHAVPFERKLAAWMALRG
jgi:hypoxanthine-DNA glycosylase